MNLYDGVIGEVLSLFSRSDCRQLPPAEGWRSVGNHSMILRSDMAYELGGEPLPSVGATFVTTGEGPAISDGLTLIGRDLPEIGKDTPYARISLLRVPEESLGEGNDLYRSIRNAENVRFAFYPEGFMQRISASRGIESVRIGRKELAAGLDFSKVGTLLASTFRKAVKAEAVHTFFITDEGFDYKALASLVKEGEEITKTIDHILKNVAMDCGTCSLQKVCSEVEGLRKMHFSMERSSKGI